MAIEDFTTYTEVEEVSDWFSVAASKIDFTDVGLNETSYVYKDYTAAHFGNFEHLITYYLSSTNLGSNTSLAGYALLNEIDEWNGVSGDGLWIFFRGSTSPLAEIRILEKDGGVEDGVDTGTISLDTIYYLTVERSGTTLTCKIYDDSGRTNLIDTLSATVINTTFRYLFGIELFDNGANGTRKITGYIENLDLQEEVPPEVDAVPLLMHLAKQRRAS